MSQSDEFIIQHTQNWIRSFIIKLNICPFAKREIARSRVRFHISHAKVIKLGLKDLLSEIHLLDEQPTVETTFLIFPSLFKKIQTPLSKPSIKTSNRQPYIRPSGTFSSFQGGKETERSYLQDFFRYLDFLDLAEVLVEKQGYEGIYQLASFHPDYCFANVAFEDVVNYTNRSPYPMIHLLREQSVEKAIALYGDTEKIPELNIASMKKWGLKKITALLKACEPQL